MENLIKKCLKAGLINIYLDDERPTPEGFVRVYDPSETIEALRSNVGSVGVLSLDHDLGDDDGVGTGYHVILWIEEQVYTVPDYIPPRHIIIHSANSSAAIKMRSGILNILKRANSNV